MGGDIKKGGEVTTVKSESICMVFVKMDRHTSSTWKSYAMCVGGLDGRDFVHAYHLSNEVEGNLKLMLILLEYN